MSSGMHGLDGLESAPHNARRGMTTKDASKSTNTKPQDRIIVALDVPTPKDAMALVKKLDGKVSFYKVGLELLMAGGMRELLQELVQENNRVFVDLKLPSDIPETVRRVVSVAAEIGIKFITLSNSATPGTVRAAVEGRGDRKEPSLLFVSFLSSLDRNDFAMQYGRNASEFETFLQARTAEAKAAGAEGFIVSGQEIRLLRETYPDALIVSPGIRPAGSSVDDHKRTCTPAEAIRLGANYIVVGRPIRNASDPKAAAQRIIDELSDVPNPGSGPTSNDNAGLSASGGIGGSLPMVAKSR
jgi:orotidine-5'-phosphate decarboxylase